jgi:hypothetical protein
MISVPISIGEFIDKISILMIKSEKVNDINKAKNVNKELDLLLSISKKIDYSDIIKLKEINEILWDCENQIRKNPNLEIAIKIITYNDLRADLKNKFNIKYNSELKEEKHYENSFNGPH